MIMVQVAAIPLDWNDSTSDMSIECSACGPVGTSPREDAQEHSFEHLRSHGAYPVVEED